MVLNTDRLGETLELFRYFSTLKLKRSSFIADNHKTDLCWELLNSCKDNLYDWILSFIIFYKMFKVGILFLMREICEWIDWGIFIRILFNSNIKEEVDMME